MDTTLHCREELRRTRVRAGRSNGFDFLEVEDRKDAAGRPAVQLRVYLLGNDPDANGRLEPCQFVIEGGRRVPRVAVHSATYVRGSRDRSDERSERDDTIVLAVDCPDDLSTYTLRLVPDPRCPDDQDDLVWSFDPRYTTLEFSFAADCPSDLDCAPRQVCVPVPLVEPAIDYLARDYSALRRLLLDRLALIMPEWKRRAFPDLWMALVEVLAYTGDRISYEQDAVATEAYLGTARKRISVRRHARLVDYLMHEGCNARAFVCLSLSAGDFHDFDELSALLFLTAKPPALALKSRTFVSTPSSSDPFAGREVFQPVVLPAGNELRASDVYDWAGVVRIVREMLGICDDDAEPPTDVPPAHHRKDHVKPLSTLEGVCLLSTDLKDKLREEGFYPDHPELQANFECWIRGRNLWARLTEDDLKSLAKYRFDPMLDYWHNEWSKWNEFRKLPAAVRTGLSVVGFDDKATALSEEAAKWFALRRVGRRLPTTLKQKLAGKPDPNDPALQSAVLAGLNRALRDRGLAGAAETDAKAWKVNRDDFHDRFEGALTDSGKHRIFIGHGEIHFWTWGNQACCLPRGATSATLADFDAAVPPPADGLRPRTLHLRVGEILIFEEILGPTTGLAADADPAHRHAVLLTRVVPGLDALYGNPVVEIEWADEDALPFPLCISVRGPADPAKCAWIDNVSVARGNVLLVDHGRPVGPEPVGKVPLESVAVGCRCSGEPGDPITRPGRLTAELANPEVTFAEPLAAVTSAASALRQDLRRARPDVKLKSIAGDPYGEKPLFDWKEFEASGWLALSDRLARESKKYANDPATANPGTLQLVSRLPADFRAWLADTTKANPGRSHDSGAALEFFVAEWASRFDLLESEADALHFVVEMDDLRKAHLRFGFDGMGRTPQAGEIFSASYRIGSGPVGNVGADRITEMQIANLSLSGAKITVRNPLPAQGGTAPESLEEVRRNAPYSFHRPLERAITADDYAALAQQCPGATIQSAACDLRWTGSRYIARVAIDALGRETAPPELLRQIADFLRPRKRIGHDVEVVSATLVPLRVTLRFCVRAHYQPTHVKQVLLELLGSGLRPDGEKGFFHPDRLTFGEPVRLSTIVATAQGVAGVASVEVRELQRLFSLPNQELETGLLPLGPLEIAQLDNDPTFPENGVLTLENGDPQ